MIDFPGLKVQIHSIDPLKTVTGSMTDATKQTEAMTRRCWEPNCRWTVRPTRQNLGPMSDCCDDGGVSDGGDSEDGRDGIDDGSDGDVSDGWLLGSEDGSLLGSDDGESSDEGSLLRVLLGDGSLLGEEQAYGPAETLEDP